MKLSKVKFQSVTKNQELSKDDQMMILGGYNGRSTCWRESGTDKGCTTSSEEAYHMGGNYHWECNTSYASDKCN